MNNQLSQSRSPYLKQHAAQPVAWQLWSAATLTQAKAVDKPILLSIGYSTCHWCHVMAHESFDNEATAALMNQHFISIKLDREERPDLDKLYQLAHQIMNQRGGGWPLTVFLDPQDLTPFFIGTYFPHEARFGLPAFDEILQKIADVFLHRRDDIRAQNSSLREALLQQANVNTFGGTLNDEPFYHLIKQLFNRIDHQNGGVGYAPKFPQPAIWHSLLHWRKRMDTAQQTQLDSALCAALDAMQRGGLFDHIGGGFFRYCVDEQWSIPHFEKMLYDNAALLGLYSDAARHLGRHDYAATARAIADWLLRDMQSPEGGFYAALDADSEAGEGDYYLWTLDEFHACLSAEDLVLAAPAFGLSQPANFEGRWHVQRRETEQELETLSGIPKKLLPAQLERIKQQLLQHRTHRSRPHRDEKQLCAWNAQVISGFCRAYNALRDECYWQAAVQALDFVEKKLWENGRLYSSYAEGVAEFSGHLDDYAHLLCALLDALQIEFREPWLKWAKQLALVLEQQFCDASHGGFFFTAEDAERVLQRPRSVADEASASGNAMAIFALQRMALVADEPRYMSMVTHALRSAWNELNEVPLHCSSTLCALHDYLSPPALLIIIGDTLGLTMFDHYRRNDEPARLILFINTEIDYALDFQRRYPAPLQQGMAYAYLCQRGTCFAPVSDVKALECLLMTGDINQNNLSPNDFSKNSDA